jgi:predicted extracellular nuclease
MKKTFWLTVGFIIICILAEAITIYDIQYTNSRGADNSYPSPYLGKQVTVEGIVNAVNFCGEGYFLSEPVSGAWRGIYIWDTEHKPKIGNYLRITGEVAEYFGMTCIRNLKSYRVLDQQRSLPNPVIISTSQLTNPLEAEAYEGVSVRIINVSVSSIKSKNGKFMANDGSGPCSVSLGNFGTKTTLPALGTQFLQISGILTFSYGEYTINPVNSDDLQIQQPVHIQTRSWGSIKSLYK